MRITWTDYLRYKASLRGFDLGIIEDIVRYSSERYFDAVTGRRIAIGRCDSKLVSIPYESDEDSIIPVTVHATTRQQINIRIKTGRFIYG